MRQAYDNQRRFDCTPIAELELNFACRDEIIPILAGLKYIYGQGELRRKLVQMVAGDVNRDSRRDVGRRGLDDWTILVLAAVRLGCNYDYDKLQDQAENHRALRTLMGVNDWADDPQFSARRIRDTLCLINPETIEAINHAIVQHGQNLVPGAAEVVRGDSFVVETNIHYPTESSLIWDGIRKIVPICRRLSNDLRLAGWRQGKHLLKQIKMDCRRIAQIARSKNPKVQARQPQAYTSLLARAGEILERARMVLEYGRKADASTPAYRLAAELKEWIGLTEQVCDTAHRRVILGEKVPNSEKLFSLFETHTQLYKRGKAGEPVQFGRQALIIEDGAGFISHYHLMDRTATDTDVVIDQMQKAQRKHGGQIKRASFDRGFHLAEQEQKLAAIVQEPCVPPKSPAQYAERMQRASITFRDQRKRHAGIESAIGAIQAGNGLKRCRDRSEIGLDRYLGLAILGRNIHILGKILIAQQSTNAQAAFNKRQAA